MTMEQLMAALERLAPLQFAEPWDNVGLILGDPASQLTGPTLLTIDLTRAVLDEALDMSASAVVAYHPPIWEPIKQISSAESAGGLLLKVMRAGINVYTPHTALDAAPGGVTDWLCDMLAEEGQDGRTLGDRRALTPAMVHDPSQTHKIVTFVPAPAVEAVRDALASVGAGTIGDYERCSFNLQGTGTFFGGEGTSPIVGEKGKLVHADEIRLEMVCPERSLALAVEMLRQFHPYEEPPFDIHKLETKPQREIGAGRRLTLDRPVPADELAARLRNNLGIDAVKLAKANDEPIQRVGVCPGAGAGLFDDALASDCQLFVTGEMRHHEALAAVAQGCSILLGGHTNTEHGYLTRYAERINTQAPAADARVTQQERRLFRTLS
jgi:dinuclear metal center YbgI/SA1388 family protein